MMFIQLTKHALEEAILDFLQKSFKSTIRIDLGSSNCDLEEFADLLVIEVSEVPETSADSWLTKSYEETLEIIKNTPGFL